MTMRVESAEITIKIPLQYDKPDANNVIYTKEAVQGAVDNFIPLCPLTTGCNMEDVIGVVDNIELSDDKSNMIIHAIVFAAGTCDDAEATDSDVVVVDKYRIISCGLGR